MRDWLQAAEFVTVDGARIAYRHLPAPGKPRVVLIHGGAAHVGWWIDVVPLLRDDFEVIVVEFSGHGDSDYRERYSVKGWAAEVAAVLRATGGEPAHIVGHSLGGVVALAVGIEFPELALTVLVIDSEVRFLPEAGSQLATGHVHYYASEDEAASHFRLVPTGTVASAQTLARVARLGLAHDPEGWRWKFDRNALGQVKRDIQIADLRKIKCPVYFIYGEHSGIADADTANAIASAVGREVPAQMIAGVYHHIPIDSPAETVAAIRRCAG